MDVTPEVKTLLEKIYSDPATEVDKGIFDRIKTHPELCLVVLLQTIAEEIASRPLLRSTVSNSSYESRDILRKREKKPHAA
jgi:hypothetical protein